MGTGLGDWTVGFHCTGLGGSIVLGWEVPLYSAMGFYCTGLLGSIVLGYGVPLYWAERFHCTGLGGSIVLGWEVPLCRAGVPCTGLEDYCTGQ